MPSVIIKVTEFHASDSIFSHDVTYPLNLQYAFRTLNELHAAANLRITESEYLIAFRESELTCSPTTKREYNVRRRVRFIPRRMPKLAQVQPG